jgi:hypothetical protein
MAATASERLAAVQSAVDRACQLLLSPTPQQLDACARLLETAVSELSALPDTAPESKNDARAQARLLKKSIGRADRLLESAAEFYSNWIRFLGALCAGYTGQGQPASVEHDARLLARG